MLGAHQQNVEPMIKKNTCAENRAIAELVYEFIKFVDDVGEESITDYLVWQWRKLNLRFNYLSVEKHTKKKENTTSGADFELELWILTDTASLPFVFQAKKLLKDYNAYPTKLGYLAANKIPQVDLLIQYANSQKKLPFYIFYSQPNDDTKTKCRMDGSTDETAIYITDAFTVKDLIGKYKNRRLSKNTILAETTPFHCLFCCPYVHDGYKKFTQVYFPNINQISFEWGKKDVPSYVASIASGSIEDAEILIQQNELKRLRNIGVLDLRSKKNDYI